MARDGRDCRGAGIRHGARHEVVGKPEPEIFLTALDGSRPADLVVGDRLDSDLAGAAAVRLDAAIVLSGVTTQPEARAARDPAPMAVSDDLHRCCWT